MISLLILAVQCWTKGSNTHNNQHYPRLVPFVVSVAGQGETPASDCDLCHWDGRELLAHLGL